MKKITEENCMETLVEQFSGFAGYWSSYIKEGGADDGLTIKLMSFARYIIDLAKNNETSELEKIFNFVEYLVCHGDESVQTAMTTGLLEGLLNISPERINFKVICPYLGKESKEYCRAWDEFCGLKTEGLWD